MVETDRDNVRAHVPATYPGTTEEFMSHVITTPGADGRAKATIVFTLNRCRDSEVVQTVHGVAQPAHAATNVAEVLVMVLWDGSSPNGFEFYALASYVSDPVLAGAFRALGLPSQATPNLVFQLDADPEQPAPGTAVPFVVEVPGAFRVDGTAMRPAAYGPAGHATHHYHGARGAIWVEHDTPTGGISGVTAQVTVTGTAGGWLGELLGAQSVPAGGLMLEKHVGHAHTAYLVD